jgi:hypothetical protein
MKITQLYRLERCMVECVPCLTWESKRPCPIVSKITTRLYNAVVQCSYNYAALLGLCSFIKFDKVYAAMLLSSSGSTDSILAIHIRLTIRLH